VCHAQVGTLITTTTKKGKQKDESVPIQDGHLFMCDYLFSLAYHAKVRLNHKWHENGEAMLLDMPQSEARVREISETKFRAELEKLAKASGKSVSCGSGKILESYDGTNRSDGTSCTIGAS
jgi:hypothetical protein